MFKNYSNNRKNGFYFISPSRHMYASYAEQDEELITIRKLDVLNKSLNTYTHTHTNKIIKNIF